jgi:hypothetical protein
MTAADLSDCRWLVSAEAVPWLAAAAQTGGSLTTKTKVLRRDLSPARAHLVLEQVELRRRAAVKFARADEMFFTPRALEQATSETVAGWKAARFASLSGNDGASGLADLCCGIGGDLLALAGQASAVGVEREKILALFAQANLAACGLNSSHVRCQDVREFSVTGFAAWHIDPDRRTARGRVAQPAFAEPGIEDLEKLLKSKPHAAIKLAPAARAPQDWNEQCEREWISERGECKQQVAWFGGLARNPGNCRATVLGRDKPRTLVGQVDVRPAVLDAPGRFVYEPDAAVLAAGLSGALAAMHGIAALGSETGYLTGDAAIRDPALAAFELLEFAPFDRKRLKTMLRGRNIGRPEIKKRGFDLDLERLQRELRGAGGEPGVILLTPIAGKVLVILARRLR